jgi:hypothetical protein
MFLNIKNEGTPINDELVDYINTNFNGIGFDQIYISSVNLGKEKEVDIVYQEFENVQQNTLCLSEEDLNQNIIDWLNTL